MKKKKLVFGADPEFFSGYKNSNGELFVLPPVVFRQKLGVEIIENDRHPIFIRNSVGIVHEDGAAFEVAISPSFKWEDIFDSIKSLKDSLESNILSKFNGICTGVVHTLPTINYEVEKWKDEGDEFKYCVEFGCDPDHDVFRTAKRARILDASQHPKRYGGGHIHISGNESIQKKPLETIMALAITVGLAAVKFSPMPALDRERTFLYGMPGKFRIQNYKKLWGGVPFTNMGVEYRTPSNAWTSSKEVAEKLFEWANIAIFNILEGNLLGSLMPQMRESTIKAIIECDQKLAGELLSFVESKI